MTSASSDSIKDGDLELFSPNLALELKFHKKIIEEEKAAAEKDEDN